MSKGGRSAFEVARQRQTVAKPFSGECIPRLLLFSSLSLPTTQIFPLPLSLSARIRELCVGGGVLPNQEEEGEPAGSLLPSRRHCCFHVSDANAEL